MPWWDFWKQFSMQLTFKKRIFDFTFTAKTSRETLSEKEVYFFILENQGSTYISECSYIKGLSRDRLEDYELTLTLVCEAFNRKAFEKIPYDLTYTHPSIQFGLECLLASLKVKQPLSLGLNSWTQGRTSIPINGLIWMNDLDTMQRQIFEKVQDQDMRCIKLKIGQHDFQEELELLHWIRSTFSDKDLTLRLDANGAFDPDDARYVLEELAYFDIHSIEQPIAPNQWKQMRYLAEVSPIPIALDEDLIENFEHKENLLQETNPAYIILKPSLLGGFVETRQWMEQAESLGINYWVTSALETKIGLNFIAQWTEIHGLNGYQGLGTGQIYRYTIPSPLELEGEKLYYNPEKNWDLSYLLS